MTGPDASAWPFGPACIDDPHTWYRTQRARAAVDELRELDTWLVTGYAPVTTVLRDPRFAAARLPDLPSGADDAAGRALHRTLAAMATLSDPPDHTRIRAPLQAAFGREVVEPFRPQIRTLVERGVQHATATVVSEGSVEVVRDLGEPLLDSVLDGMLGWPAGMGAAVRGEWRHVARSVDDPDAGLPEDAVARLVELYELVLGRLRRPGAPSGAGPWARRPVDVLVEAAEGAGLSDTELVANVLLARTSGHRSAVQAMALALHTLATHPAQYEVLRRTPGAVAGAVEELLRWDGPVHFTARVARADVSLGSHTIPSGATVMAFLAAANRDPAACPHAEQLDLLDPPRRHLAFGRGIHFCAGAALARLVLQETLAAFVAAVERPELVVAPTWNPVRRGVEHLWLRW